MRIKGMNGGNIFGSSKFDGIYFELIAPPLNSKSISHIHCSCSCYRSYSTVSSTAFNCISTQFVWSDALHPSSSFYSFTFQIQDENFSEDKLESFICEQLWLNRASEPLTLYKWNKNKSISNKKQQLCHFFIDFNCPCEP